MTPVQRRMTLRLDSAMRRAGLDLALDIDEHGNGFVWYRESGASVHAGRPDGGPWAVGCVDESGRWHPTATFPDVPDEPDQDDFDMMAAAVVRCVRLLASRSEPKTAPATWM